VAGRKHVPTSVKLLKGSYRKDRENAREPKPAVGAPPARRGMAADVRTWYRRLVTVLDPLRVATAADGIALELCASALVEHFAARAVITRDGATYTTVTPAGSTMTRARPEVAIAAEAWRRGAAMLRDFGLSPASRPRVNAAPPDRGENPFERLERTQRFFGADAADKYFEPPRRRSRGSKTVRGLHA